jgi:hypothetical protein
MCLPEVMGKWEVRKPHNPCENQCMACISRIPKNRILDFDPESRPRSLNCDVIDKSSNDNSKHRHMLAIQLHLLYDTVPSPISIQVQVFNSSNLQSTSSRLTKTSIPQQPKPRKWTRSRTQPEWAKPSLLNNKPKTNITTSPPNKRKTKHTASG